MKSELKPCPFCGGKAEIRVVKEGEMSTISCAMKFFDGKTSAWRLDFSFDEIGKTVFLTREEAEKALAERSRQ